MSSRTLTDDQKATLAYVHAETIASKSGLSLDDIADLTPKFWELWTSPTLCLDGAATTLFSIQYNLVAGTLAKFGSDRDDISPVIDDILSFRTIGQFCLTELDHGLDAFNLETTATLTDDMTFILNTPHPGAAKFMPPTVPVLGKPCIGIVFARLLVSGQTRGIRPFLVPLNDGYRMNPGVTSRCLPYRGASTPVNHSLTSFNNVRLPLDALLGNLDTSLSPHQDFLLSIWRVSVGTLSLAMIAVPALQISSYISFSYSKRRLVRGKGQEHLPIFQFRTQQIPVYTAISRAYVLKAFGIMASRLFSDSMISLPTRHAIATAFKVVTIRLCQDSQIMLADRCGAQGLFDFNQISQYFSEIRGISIAEGDTLVLSIRLATEILLGRYTFPTSADPHSLVSKHEQGIIEEFRHILLSCRGHRDDQYATQVLPQCQSIVEAIGYRLAYDAALEAKVPQPLIDIYVFDVVSKDLAWYIETGILSRAQFRDMEDRAISGAHPFIEGWVQEISSLVGGCVTSPIISASTWESFVKELDCFTHVESLPFIHSRM